MTFQSPFVSLATLLISASLLQGCSTQPEEAKATQTVPDASSETAEAVQREEGTLVLVSGAVAIGLDDQTAQFEGSYFVTERSADRVARQDITQVKPIGIQEDTSNELAQAESTEKETDTETEEKTEEGTAVVDSGKTESSAPTTAGDAESAVSSSSDESPANNSASTSTAQSSSTPGQAAAQPKAPAGNQGGTDQSVAQKPSTPAPAQQKPAVKPQPAPASKPQPAPAPKPEVKPAPKPAPAPAPKPTPAPAPAPAPAPKPTPAPAPAPAPSTNVSDATLAAFRNEIKNNTFPFADIYKTDGGIMIYGGIGSHSSMSHIEEVKMAHDDIVGYLKTTNYRYEAKYVGRIFTIVVFF